MLRKERNFKCLVRHVMLLLLLVVLTSGEHFGQVRASQNSERKQPEQGSNGENVDGPNNLRRTAILSISSAPDNYTEASNTLPNTATPQLNLTEHKKHFLDIINSSRSKPIVFDSNSFEFVARVFNFFDLFAAADRYAMKLLQSVKTRYSSATQQEMQLVPYRLGYLLLCYLAERARDDSENGDQAALASSTHTRDGAIIISLLCDEKQLNPIGGQEMYWCLIDIIRHFERMNITTPFHQHSFRIAFYSIDFQELDEQGNESQIVESWIEELKKHRQEYLLGTKRLSNGIAASANDSTEGFSKGINPYKTKRSNTVSSYKPDIRPSSRPCNGDVPLYPGAADGIYIPNPAAIHTTNLPKRPISAFLNPMFTVNTADSPTHASSLINGANSISPKNGSSQSHLPINHNRTRVLYNFYMYLLRHGFLNRVIGLYTFTAALIVFILYAFHFL